MPRGWEVETALDPSDERHHISALRMSAYGTKQTFQHTPIYVCFQV